MQQRQFFTTSLALLASNLILFALFSAGILNHQAIFIVGWSLIVLQAVATIMLFMKKKMTAAAVGAVWVSVSLLIQLIRW